MYLIHIYYNATIEWDIYLFTFCNNDITIIVNNFSNNYMNICTNIELYGRIESFY